MSEHPWDADRELTVAQATEAIRSQFPDVAANAVQPIGSGWDNDAFFVDDLWIFRFPRRRNVADQLDKERGLAPIVARALSDLGIAVPAMSMPGEPCDDFPYRFTGYPRLAGTPADQLPEDQIDATVIPETLGAALVRLHSIPVSEVADLGRDVVDVDADGPEPWLQEAQLIADDLSSRETGEVAECVAWLANSPIVPEHYSGELRLIHNDLSPDHVLVDSETHRVVGLLDFGDAALGDPALDFVVLPSWLGWEKTERVLRAYATPTDSGLLERLRFLSRAGSLIWLHDTHLQNADVEKHRRWVLNAFGSA